MSDAEDRILDLALEEVFCSRSRLEETERIDAVLRRIRGTRSHPEVPGSPRRHAGRKVAAVAASFISFALASWFVLGRVDPKPATNPLPTSPGTARAPQDGSPGSEIQQLIDKLSDPDGAVREQASQALQRKGPDLLDLFREKLAGARDAEARQRLQALITYWTHAVAARVDGEIVTWEMVDSCLKDIRPSDISEELRRQMLRQIVEERAFLREARRQGIVVTEEEVREGLRPRVEAFGGEEAYRSALRAKGSTVEGEREGMSKQLSIQKLYHRILEDARANPGANPFGLDVNETPREEIRRWYDTHPDKFAGVDTVNLCWIELPFDGDQDRLAKKALAEAVTAKAQTKKNLALACVELGVKEPVHIAGLERGARLAGPFDEETRKLLFETFKFGEVRMVEEKSFIHVIQLYDRVRRISEPFEQAEPQIRAMLENERLEANRRNIRKVLHERARIIPEDLFQNR